MSRVRPLFLFGFERSGTTLLSMMVGAHRELAVPLATTGMWYRVGEAVETQFGGLHAQTDLERLVDSLLAEERIRLWDHAFTRDEVLDGLPRGNWPAVVARFHELYARKAGKAHWGNIDIATLRHLATANAWFPDARFIHIVRDGRDVALSHLTMPYGAANIGECAEKWSRELELNIRMGAMIPSDRYLVVRYEDLVLEPEPTLARMCAFIGVDYDPGMLDYPGMVERKIPEDRRWLWPAIDRAPDRSKVFGWRSRLSTTQRVVFEWSAARMLRELGYDTLDPVPRAPGAYALELWYFLGRGHRLTRLARKLGFKRASVLERRHGARTDG